jgi:formate hydrogenlyase transcriptional activator
MLVTSPGVEGTGPVPAERDLVFVRFVAETFAVDRCTVYELDAAGTPHQWGSWVAPDAAAILEPSENHLAPRTLERVLAGEVVTGDVPENEWAAIKSTAVVPIPGDGRVAGALALDAMQGGPGWTPAALDRLQAVAGVFAHVLGRQQDAAALRAALADVRRLKADIDQIKSERRDDELAAEERRLPSGASRVVGRSAAIRAVMELVEQVAPTDSTVLLLGETGTGKELFASQLHGLGNRRQRPMVRVNCAAIPATLIESELFGREKGAFTGALSRQVGRFELANHSTIFLDEVGDLPLDVQVKLLRVLEERKIERLGSPQPIAVDVRIVAATHRNLEQAIGNGTFRQDLFYRLNVFPIHVPPLRERVEDIPLLIWRFVEEFSAAFGKRIDSISKENLAALQQYSWPGNIRELRNVVERAMIAATGSRLTIAVPQASSAATKRSPKLLDVEKEHIRAILESTGWRIRGAGGAADRLGLKPTTLETRMAKLGLKRPGVRRANG